MESLKMKFRSTTKHEGEEMLAKFSFLAELIL